MIMALGIKGMDIAKSSVQLLNTGWVADELI